MMHQSDFVVENVLDIRPMLLHFRNFVFFDVHVFQACSMFISV